MAIGLLRRLAANAPVAFFAAVGRDAIERVEDLSLDPRVAWVASPRQADVLLVAGDVRAEDRQALRVVHDQVVAPKASLWWGSRPFDEPTAPALLAFADEPVAHLLELRDRAGSGAGEPGLLPDGPPHPWRGIGPHGQGGKGMMGGVPYGRPMAMTGADGRDGLMLDEVTVTLGPYLKTWPAGLVLELVLQGDVIQRARVVRPPFGPTEGAGHGLSPGLRSGARILELLHLAALAERCRRAALASDRGEVVDLDALRRAVARSGAFVAMPPRLGSPHAAGAASTATDLRSRLQAWLGDRSQTQASAHADRPHRLADLLRGLEWNEAMLVVNGFSPAELHDIAPIDAAADAQDGGQAPAADPAAEQHAH